MVGTHAVVEILRPPFRNGLSIQLSVNGEQGSCNGTATYFANFIAGGIGTERKRGSWAEIFHLALLTTLKSLRHDLSPAPRTFSAKTQPSVVDYAPTTDGQPYDIFR